MSYGTRNSVAIGLGGGAAVGVSSATVPGAPTIGTATQASSTSVSVTFTAPASDGGSAITSYTATSSPGGLTATGAGSPLVVTGLTTGVAYTFTVTATNAIGTGAASAASNSVTPSNVYATLDPANKGAGVVLSGGNLTFTANAEMVLATIGKSTGKWYWEVTHTSANGASGVAGGAENTAVSLGIGVLGFGYWGTTGEVMRNNFARASYATYTTEVIGYALDADAQTLAIYKANTLQGTVNIIASGRPIYPACSALTGGGGGTANFGASAFTYTPPSGYNSGVYT